MRAALAAMAGENYAIPFKPAVTLSENEAQACLSYILQYELGGTRTAMKPEALKDQIVFEVIHQAFFAPMPFGEKKYEGARVTTGGWL